MLLLPAALATAPDEVPGLGPIAAVAALGVVGTGIAFVIFYWLIASVGPARAFLVTYIAPGFAVVYGATLLDEEITAATIAGPGPDPRRLVARGRGQAAGATRPRWQPRPPRCPPRTPGRAGRSAGEARRRGAAAARRGSAPRRARAARRAMPTHVPEPIASPHSSGPRGQLNPRRIAVSMSSGDATPLAERERGLVDELGDDPAQHGGAERARDSSSIAVVGEWPRRRRPRVVGPMGPVPE